MKYNPKRLASVGAFLLAGALAHGTIIFADDFEARSSGDLDGQGTWTSPSGLNQYTVETDGGLGNVIIGGGNQRIFTESGSGDGSSPTFATFAAESHNQIFVRFNYNATATSGGPFFSFRLTDDDGDFNSTLGITVQNGQLRPRSTNASGGITQLTSGVPAISADTTHTIVFMAEKTGAAGDNFDRVTAWLNPALAGENADDLLAVANLSGGVVATADTGVSSFSAISFQKGSSGGQAAIQLDSMMVAIPEPSVYAALLSLGALAIIVLLRRHR